jgi:hypothetical protein
MAKQVRSVDFLPEIFQTPANRQFLSATLDQLIQNPKYTQTQGFIGRRIGPGVNANDKYVIEPTKTRTDYQLEPGVIQTDPADTRRITDAITYPGITDALDLQGAYVNNADRLYTSDYYTWDPFVDFDKLVNYAQYYWLPKGPLAVDVKTNDISLFADYTVTRANGAYTFSNLTGANPEINLVQGGTYTFNVAQNNTETATFRVTDNGTSSWNIDYEPNPTLTLVRGNTYVFNLSQTAPWAFFIKTELSLDQANLYNTGVVGNGASRGLITFTVPQSAPDTLYYCNDVQFNLRGQINIIDPPADTGGPGFWIQVEPGVSGRLGDTPNISSRDVLGVTNNGTDRGQVTFEVPLATAQDFYYGLPSIGVVDLVTDLAFDQINNQFIDTFLRENPTGIDGETQLNSRTIAFISQDGDPFTGGWERTSFFDPLLNVGNVVSGTGSYDTTLYDETDYITDRPTQYGVWRIDYKTAIGGGTYISLQFIQNIPVDNKFTVGYGVAYSNTSWYKRPDGYLERIPLLTADRKILFYQDGADPGIFGQINIIDPRDINNLDVNQIIGRKNYTSPNGVVFTNGLKVVFRGNVTPASYQNNEYYVDGVGTAIRLLPVQNYVTPETYTNNVSDPFDSTPYDFANFDGDLNQPFVPDYITISRSSPDLNAWTRSNRWFHIDVVRASATYNNTTLILDQNQRARRPILEFDSGLRLFNNGTQGKAPINIFDFTQTDALSNVNGSLGYSIDGYTLINGSRIVFAKDNDPLVRNKIYTVTFAEPDSIKDTKYFDGDGDTKNFYIGGIYLGAKTVITEVYVRFNDVDWTLQLYGSAGEFISDDSTDPQQLGYTYDPVTEQIRFINAPGVGKKVKVVANILPQPVIVLTEASDGEVLIDQTTVGLDGETLQGITYRWDGVEWIESQQKTQVNQPPLFDLYDKNGVSFGDRARYPSSNFRGSPLFSYAIGDADPDIVLGFPLTYLSLTNIGDIVFDNNLYKDTFNYTIDSIGYTLDISTGFARQYFDRETYDRRIGWQTAATPSLVRQQFQFAYTGDPLLLDVAVTTNQTVPPIQIYINGQFVPATDYRVTRYTDTTTIDLLQTYVVDDVIEISVLSEQVSTAGFYEVPINLSNNPLNGNSEAFSLGTIRNHYTSLAENLVDLQGPAIGPNNVRDLGNVVPYGLQILQQSSPLTLTGYFMRDAKYDIFGALAFNSTEYIKFKSQLLTAVTSFSLAQYGSWTVARLLDESIAQITQGKTDINSFYWSDMLPTGPVFTTNSYTVNPVTEPVFNLVQTYDYSQANYKGLCVYLNNVILQRDQGYQISPEGTTLLILVPLAVGDVVTINEYANTAGNFCPNTPTKMGLYPAWRPSIFEDQTAVNPVPVIQGHDGSITVAFGDIRDQVLLEFETRIYNNLKLDGNPVPLSATDVIPGFFRTTSYTQQEITQILGEDFLTWAGANKLDYTAQTYQATNAFTYNYSQSGNRINNAPLLGAWRGIYRYFYDTLSPATTPWEMLGFSQQPDWWESRYGTPPYTSDNLVLWEDLAQGLVADPVAPYVLPQYRRPGLVIKGVTEMIIDTGGSGYSTNDTVVTLSAPPPGEFSNPAKIGRVNITAGSITSIEIEDPGSGYLVPPLVTITSPTGSGAVAYADVDVINGAIPVDSQGNMLPPLENLVGPYNPLSFVKSWQVGDGGPVEASWWQSSSYPFAIMRLLVLTRPAEFFSLFADRDLYRYSPEFDQYLYDGRYRIQPQSLQLYGSGTSKASYINWIVDYNRQSGVSTDRELIDDLANLDVRLCYRTAAFVTAQNLSLFLEKGAPGSQNVGVQVPPESYNLLLYKNQPFGRVKYSAVIVEAAETGYTVYGYSRTDPYFTIQESRVTGLTQTLTAGTVSVTVPSQYLSTTRQVAYGYTFTNLAGVVDFLLGYGEYLRTQGLSFVAQENGYVLDWKQMSQEFLYFADQGWSPGTIINLNPSATQLIALRPGATVDSILTYTPENLLLDQNRLAFDVRNLIVQRENNLFTLAPEPNGTQTINYLQLQYVDYEHMVVLDNRTIFNDLIYNTITAERQNRIRLSATVTTEWNGNLNAQGFILNDNNVMPWKPNTKYTKGEIVRYKNNYWQAATIVEPTQTFNFNNWYKSNYDLIEQGLLQNLATKSDQLANSYNTQTANINRDNDLLSYGLIGFKPRQYMTDLTLSDTSQINLYQQFIKTMGSLRATDLFTNVSFSKEQGQYTIYENWGILTGTYGANANRSWFEIALNEALLTGNPSTVEIIQPGETSQANQTILLKDLWAESYAIPSVDILPTTYVRNPETGLPTAGYVNFNDVDITVFNLDDPSNIAANLSTIGNGTTIWVAQENTGWNIYQCAQTPGRLLSVTDNLNGTSQAQFSTTQNLAVGDLIIIRYFDTAIDGVYRVLAVPAIDTVVIQYQFLNTNQTTITGTGIVFYLQTMRVAQPSDIINLPYANQLVPGARAWVDNNGAGLWQVLRKTAPFTATDLLEPLGRESNSRFGTSIAQSNNNFAMLVGAPGAFSGQGRIYTYCLDETNQYIPNSILTLTATAVAGFGDSVDFGNRTWAVAGASASDGGAGYAAILYLVPGTNNYLTSQLLTAPDPDYSTITGFGATVRISTDERWLYVGAPGVNSVYAYARVDEPLQSVTYTANGTVRNFNWSDYLEVTAGFPEQIAVYLNDAPLTLGVNYTISGNFVAFAVPPDAGAKILIARRVEQQLDYIGPVIAVEPFLYTATTIDSLTVLVDKVIQRPNIDYTFDPLTKEITFVTLPALGAVVLLQSTLGGAYWQYVDPIKVDGMLISTSSTSLMIPATTFSPMSLTVATGLNYQVGLNVKVQYDTLNYMIATVTSYNNNTGSLVILPNQKLGSGTYSFWTIQPLNQFGTSIAIDTTGTQILIGSPGDIALDSAGNTISSAGAVYAFDRSIVAYVISDPAQLTYAIPGAYNHVSVVLNNQILLSTEQSVNGQYTQVGSNIVLASSVTLAVGDTLEIATNQFQFVQKITARTGIDNSRFGQALDICSNNCSVYIGAPLDSFVTGVAQSGMVEREVNQSRTYGITTSQIANPALTAGDTIRINNILVAVPAAPDNTVAGLVSAINAAKISNVTASNTPDLRFIGDGTNKIFDIGSTYSAAESYTTVVLVNDVPQTQGIDYTYDTATRQILFVVAPALNAIVRVISGRMTISVLNLAAAEAFNVLTVLPGATGTAFTDLGFETYAYTQSIASPNPTEYAQFGASVNVNTGSVNLVVGSPNGDVYEPTIFDGGETYFDDRSTTVFGYTANAGVVFTYDFLPSLDGSIANPGKFVFGQQVYIVTPALSAGDRFGAAVNYRNNRLMVGTPGSDLGDSSASYGQASVFDNPNNGAAWQVEYQQLPSADVNLLNSVYTYNKLLNSNQTYFDFIDPLQGKILGVAQRNIDYTGAVDPAQYNVGAIHRTGTSWGPAHEGEIWWDTNRVRFIDANQDSITYASRRWAQVFPGSSIDIYQWVGSPVPPLNYTGAGVPLSTTSYSVFSTLDNQGIVVTTYYFWVRGIATVATQFGKTLSATAIATYIQSPLSSGLPYIAALSANSVALYNAKSLLSASDTILHIEYDRQVAGGNGDIHTEYQFIADGKATDFLNDNLYRKLLDSLCGVNIAGAAVPDPNLSPGMQYGVQFRPRQSMFVNRFRALQNYIGYANRILIQYPVAETRSIPLLDSAEPLPASTSSVNATQINSGLTYTISFVGTTDFTLIGAASNTVGVTFVATAPGRGTGIATTTIWDQEVPNLETLGYQDLNQVPTGYQYLVLSNSEYNGRWTIYIVTRASAISRPELLLARVQNYDTPLFWSYEDWYLPGYNSTIQPLASVDNTAGLKTLSLQDVPVGGSVEVRNNTQGKFEIYRRTALDWQLVGIQDGTIQFSEKIWNYAVGGFGFDEQVFDSQFYDQDPVIETRQIIRSINEELFTGDLLIHRNRALMLMFHFIYTEQASPDWLIKTSYINVDHNVRGLLPYQLFQPDNQTFVLDYLNEVKPYHVQNLAFNLIYGGTDTYGGQMTDFDVPAFWDTSLALPQFVSPILLPYTYSDSVTQSYLSDTPANSQIWLEDPWKEWYNNYQLEVVSVTMITGGSGYTLAPTVEVVGACTTPAQLTAVINSAGRVIAITVDDPGAGYSVTPTIVLTDGNGTGARAVAVMGNTLVRSIKTVIKYDRCEYTNTVTPWQANVVYEQGELVRYLNRVWSAKTTQASAVFTVDDWTFVPASDLNAADRTMGYYQPTPDMPGLSLPLLIDGVSYPGVQVFGLGFDNDTGYDVGNFDINVYDNYSVDEYGLPTYDPAILDARYGSYYGTPSTGKIPTGLGPTDINVAGGAYIDTFSSHAPEELIPGSEFDTLDMRVYSTPGADWQGRGHGFPAGQRRYTYDPDNPVLDFEGIIDNPMYVILFNVTLGLAIEPLAYDWANYEMTVDPALASPGDVLVVYVTGTGGGNQLFNGSYLGTELIGGNQVIIPFPTSLAPTPPIDSIYELVIYNGEILLEQGADYDYEPFGTNKTLITFTHSYGATDRINLTALGFGYNGVNYGWSIPQSESILVTDPGQTVYTLTKVDFSNTTNAINLIVVVNGQRARPSEGIRYIGNGVTVDYSLPDRGDYSQGLIAINDVAVYVTDRTTGVCALQVLNVDYVVNPWDGSSVRTITFLRGAPALGTLINIAVRTQAQYWIVDNQLIFQPSAGLTPTVGSLIEIVSWADTREQDILTQVFVGPEVQGTTIEQGYDIADYDAATVSDTSGSFDFGIGTTIDINVFDTGREILDPNRILVTLDGKWLFSGLDYGLEPEYEIQGTAVKILGPAIPPDSVVVITSFTPFTVPGPMAFRIFQDMRGAQATYRITPDTTTVTTAAVTMDSDVIYVENITALSEPNLDANVWGVLTIDAERIMYRYRDPVARTVSGLMRGTAGTARAAHANGAIIYNMGLGNLLPEQYQNFIESNSFLGDGTTTVFEATDVNVIDFIDSTLLVEAVEVYVGGTRVTAGYSIIYDNPVIVEFDTAPPDGVGITILIRKGKWWYNVATEAQKQQSLQESNNPAARFLRGL